LHYFITFSLLCLSCRFDYCRHFLSLLMLSSLRFRYFRFDVHY
jgi:hypothetical protein